MRKYTNKILILGFIGILIVGFGAWRAVQAADSSIYVSPAQLSKKIGDVFNVSVKIKPNGEKICLVEGKLNLSKLSCQNITIGSSISAQTSPSCDDLNFLLGIQGCATSDKTIFTIAVKAESAGSGIASFTGIDIIGEGVSLSSTWSGGSYVITSPCNCGAWSAWQDGACGAGNCSSDQRLQTRTRVCTPSGCEAKNENQCRDDLGCIPRLPAKEIEKEKEEKVEAKEVKKEVIGQPAEEEVIEEPQEQEKDIAEEIDLFEEKIPQKSLLAGLAGVFGEITQSVFLIIIVVLCLIGLAFIGIKQWRLFQKRRRK